MVAMTPDQLAQYNNLYQQATNTQAPVNPIGVTNGGASQGLQNFFNTPEYAALYGSQSGANNAQAAANGTYNPVNAFQNSDPSYQYNMNQALTAVNNSSAAKGLLQSGQTQRDLLTTASGLQNNQYQTWLGQQNSLFGNYQTQLQSLSALGTANNGANMANSNAQTLSNNLGQANLSTGQNIASANQNTGSNISSLFANQGALNAGAILNTGAAQSNNIMQGNQFQTQVNAANLASNAQTANGQMGAAGQQQATGSLF